MNTNMKAILASTLLTALFAGQTAIAGDNDHFAVSDSATITESVAIQKVSFQSPAVETGYVFENSNH